MVSTQGLYAFAEQQHIPVLAYALPQTGSVSIDLGEAGCFIGIDEAVIPLERQRKVHLAHELGHCMTGSFYNRYAPQDLRQKHENQADRWAIQTTITPQDLDEAVAMGCTDLWMLAEHFSVTEAFMRKVVCLYTHGNLADELYF